MKSVTKGTTVKYNQGRQQGAVAKVIAVLRNDAGREFTRDVSKLIPATVK